MSPRTIRIIQGERLTAFSIANPCLAREEYTELPQVRSAGSGGGGIDTNLPWGPFPEDDGSSSIAFENHVFGPEKAQQYAVELANKLGAIIIEPSAGNA